MTQKRSKATPHHTGVALGIGKCSAASSSSEFNAQTHSDQSRFAVDMIARRFRVSPATARANVEAFGFGGRQ